MKLLDCKSCRDTDGVCNMVKIV